MLRFAIAGLLALTATQTFAEMVTISPRQIGDIFCIARLGNDMAPVDGLLTPNLASTIADAESRSDAIQKQFPDDKPPLGDGVPWQTWPDYADGCTAEAATDAGATTHVAIHYSFKASPDANFTDQLTLIHTPADDTGGTHWRIDDIVYSDGTTLRTALKNAFSDN